MKQNLKRCIGLFFGLILILAFCLVSSSAQEKMKIGGEFTAKYGTVGEEQEIGDVEEHTVYLSTLKGINKSTGEQKFMDGAEVLIIAMSDVTKGNGVAWGYTKMTQGDDVVFAKYKGKVTTTIVEGNPVTVFEVEAKYIKGTGKYANIQGGHKAKAQVISEDELAITWEGKYSIKK